MERSSNLKIARCPLSCRADRLFTFSIIAYPATALQDEIKKGEEECGWSRRRKRQPTGSLPTREAAESSVFTATSPISCDVAIEIKRRRPECRVYLVCEEGHPDKQPALDKAVELAGGLGCKKADTGHAGRERPVKTDPAAAGREQKRGAQQILSMKEATIYATNKK